MKQSLQLRLGQQLTMTPQLQQAIRLLQLSSLELQMEVQQALESNLMLEEGEEEYAEGEEDGPAAQSVERAEAPEELPRAEEASTDTLPDELPVDSAWDDIYEPTQTYSGPEDDEDRAFEYGDTSQESLHEHLMWQLEMTPLSETDRAIGEAIIDAIDEDGLLGSSVEDICEAFDNEEIEVEEVTAVLHIVQNFDPPGVGARNLQENLSIQLRQMPNDLDWREAAQALVDEHFDLLAARDYNQLKRRLKLGEEELIEVLHVIQSLNPRPGAQISANKPQYIVPDVIVRKVKGAWRVELNPEATPKLRINSHYASLIKQVNNNRDSTTLKNHLQEARWFIKSLVNRNETLLRVATSIVQHQREFLELGEVAMKAMVLHDVAEELGLHESTISRVTTNKYMHTPRGVFELKYFFSSHVETEGGGECSSTAIRALIKQMIAEENSTKPLSDNKLAQILAKQGIKVARRTVAKYREAMAIPPSNERKRLA